MHVLLNPLGSHGDVHPFVGVGLELRRRGHDVTLATSAHFAPLAAAAGLDFAAIGTDADFHAGLQNPRVWHPFHGPRVIFKDLVLPSLDRAFDVLRSRVVPGRTVVVAGTLGFAARILQEATGVPLVTVHLSPMCFRSAIDPPVWPGAVMPKSQWARRAMFRLADALVIDPMLARPLNARRRAFGLPPVKRVLDVWWNSPTRVIGMFPDWFAAPQTDWPPQTVLTGFPLYDERGVTPLPDALDAFLNAGPPPIAFTPGSAMIHGHAFFRAAVDACARLGRRGVLLTRHPDQVPPNLPPTVAHAAYAPFGLLLPRCAAIVHHGGVGTTAQGLVAGVPQLIMPMSHDQPDNAARLARLGVGASVAPRRFTGKAVAEALRKLLDDPGVSQRARRLAGRFAVNDGIEKAADAILQMTPGEGSSDGSEVMTTTIA